MSSILYWAQGGVLAFELPVWSEQTSTVVGPSFVVLEAEELEDGVADLRLPQACESAGIVRSDVRPTAYVCVAGLAWPLLSSPYASGVLYWPLGIVPLLGGDLLATRGVGLLFGWLGLLVLFDLVARLSDHRRASVTVLIAALLSPYLVLHALAVYYETVPSLVVLLGVAVLLRDAAPHPSGARLAVVGVAFGLAVTANVKALVLLAVLLGLARLLRARALRAPISHWLAFGLAFGLTVLPAIILATSDPHAGVSSQVGTRIATALSHLSPRFILLELGNILVFAVDFAFYFAIAGGAEPSLPWPAAAVAGMAVLGSTSHLVRGLRGLPFDPSAAAAAALLWVYAVFVALVYQQTPSANYGPVVHAFAPALAIPLVDAFDALRARRVAFGAAALVLVAPGGLWLATTHARGRAGWHAVPSIDLGAEREIARALREGADDVPLFTLTYNHAGVFDALAPGRRPSATVHPLLARCDGEPEPTRCREQVLEALLCRGSAHVVVPLVASRIDESGVSELPALVDRVAEGCGIALTTEAEGSWGGVPALRLVRVGPPAR